MTYWYWFVLGVFFDSDGCHSLNNFHCYFLYIIQRFEMCFRGKKGTREGNKLGQCEGRVEKQKERIRQRAVIG